PRDYRHRCGGRQRVSHLGAGRAGSRLVFLVSDVRGGQRGDPGAVGSRRTRPFVAGATTALRQGTGTPPAGKRLMDLARRTLIVTGTVAVVVVVLILAWLSWDVLLLGFGGLVLAVFLRTLADWIAGRTHLGPSWSLALAV